MHGRQFIANKEKLSIGSESVAMRHTHGILFSNKDMGLHCRNYTTDIFDCTILFINMQGLFAPKKTSRKNAGC